MITNNQESELWRIIEAYVDARVDYETSDAAVWYREETVYKAEKALNAFIKEITE